MDKRKRSKWLLVGLSTILGVVLLTFVVVSQTFAASCFTDTEGHWAETYICWMFDNGLSIGFPDGTFRPADNVNRAQMAVFMQQLSGHGTAAAVVNADQIDGMDYGTQTGYLSIPAAAFVPREDGYNYASNGDVLVHISGPSDLYYAPILLPHASTVTRVTFYWKDLSTANDGAAWLERSDFTSNNQNMTVDLFTSGDAGVDSSTMTTVISYPSVNNSQRQYYLGLCLPDSDIFAYGVIIEYTYNGLG